MPTQMLRNSAANLNQSESPLYSQICLCRNGTEKSSGFHTSECAALAIAIHAHHRATGCTIISCVGVRTPRRTMNQAANYVSTNYSRATLFKMRATFCSNGAKWCYDEKSSRALGASSTWRYTMRAATRRDPSIMFDDLVRVYLVSIASCRWQCSGA